MPLYTSITDLNKSCIASELVQGPYDGLECRILACIYRNITCTKYALTCFDFRNKQPLDCLVDFYGLQRNIQWRVSIKAQWNVVVNNKNMYFPIFMKSFCYIFFYLLVLDDCGVVVKGFNCNTEDQGSNPDSGKF